MSVILTLFVRPDTPNGHRKQWDIVKATLPEDKIVEREELKKLVRVEVNDPVIEALVRTDPRRKKIYPYAKKRQLKADMPPQIVNISTKRFDFAKNALALVAGTGLSVAALTDRITPTPVLTNAMGQPFDIDKDFINDDSDRM